jgi:hypothetical protein
MTNALSIQIESMLRLKLKLNPAGSRNSNLSVGS